MEKADMGRILRKLCEEKGVEILEAEAWPDHIPHAGKHTAEYKCSAVYGALKREKQPRAQKIKEGLFKAYSIMRCCRRANLKYKYGNRHFGAEGINRL